jgi:hypothetical protein
LGTIWYDEGEINEFAGILYEKAKKTNDLIIPYQSEIEQIFDSSSTLSKTDADMLLSSLYILYAKKTNPDAKKSSYNTMLADFLNYNTIEESTANAAKAEDDGMLFEQYYKLQDVLKDYKKIRKI